MRRSRRLLLLLPLLLAGGAFLTADEGQWLPEQIRDFDWVDLEKRGLELKADEIWDGEHGLLSAAVNLGGCSASFVSPEGLIVTNHHCGYGAINAHSTPENNRLVDGFAAADLTEELPARGMTVSIVRGYQDVTAEMHAAMEAAGGDPAARKRAVDARRRELADEAKGPGRDAIVVPYFEGREWRRILRTVFEDVRLVYAPPAAIGEYGGEEDNWMWPRHTGDFCFFRAYAAPDGTPAKFDPDNVPYRPGRWLEVSEEGVGEGDLVMVLGYPGRTERYLSSVAVATREAWYYPMRERVFAAMIDGIRESVAGDETAELRSRARIKGLSNGLKNAQGMVWGLSRNKVVERKQAEEADFRAWVAADRRRQERYGAVLDELLELDRRELVRQERDFLLDTLSRYSGLARMGKELADHLRSDGAPGDDGLLRKLRSASGRVYAESEAKLFGVVFEELWAMPPGQRMALWDKLFLGVENREQAARAGRNFVRDCDLLDPETWPMIEQPADDPLVWLMDRLEADLDELEEFRTAQAGARMDVGSLWIQAQEEWRGERFYPDANSTLRVSVASVKGYSPRDGVWHTPRTTVRGLLEKHTGAAPFDAPGPLRTAGAGAGEVPVCFLSDADTTGGNSGSPVVDGKGRLVGLNFDRVFENVSGDFGWNAERSRNVSVDIRYVLWLLREVYPSPRLLEEMKTVGMVSGSDE
ncbi:MAG: S46 family peptidase [Planctomycetes bacterium]|nr:S46 family peptidase [Planctomycetota bacterium]